MNKKFVFIVFTGLLALIILFSILAYRHYLAPVYHQNLDQIKTISINDTPKKVVFSKRKNQGNPFSLELEISGRTKKHFSLIISNPEGAVHTARVKGGKASFTYVSDWYSDTVELDVLPDKGERGKLTFKCRFIAL